MINFRQDYCLIIAEIGINHNGDLNLAFEMIDAAAKAGADIVKFQNISEETGFNYADKNNEIYEAIKKYSLHDSDYVKLKQRCLEKKVLFMSSAADVPAARFLTNLGVPGVKVSSGNFTNFHLLKEIGKTKGLPLIISTGTSTTEERDEVVAYIRKLGIEKFALTYCVSEYPAKLENINLEVMTQMAERYKVPVGFSDHTEGIITSLLARAKGACVIEKHFTLDKNMDGPDHGFSLTPDELKALAKGVRDIEKVLFAPKLVNAGEVSSKGLIRRSMYFMKNLPKGTVLEFDDIAAKRPFKEKGISPMAFEEIIGKQVNTSVVVDQLVTKDLLQ